MPLLAAQPFGRRPCGQERVDEHSRRSNVTQRRGGRGDDGRRRQWGKGCAASVSSPASAIQADWQPLSASTVNIGRPIRDARLLSGCAPGNSLLGGRACCPPCEIETQCCGQTQQPRQSFEAPSPSRLVCSGQRRWVRASWEHVPLRSVSIACSSRLGPSLAARLVSQPRSGRVSGLNTWMPLTLPLKSCGRSRSKCSVIRPMHRIKIRRGHREWRVVGAALEARPSAVRRRGRESV